MPRRTPLNNGEMVAEWSQLVPDVAAVVVVTGSKKPVHAP